MWVAYIIETRKRSGIDFLMEHIERNASLTTYWLKPSEIYVRLIYSGNMINLCYESITILMLWKFVSIKIKIKINHFMSTFPLHFLKKSPNLTSEEI